jgi:hypothetical protein
MSLVLQSSGGGSVTIAEPTTASNFTQDLPAVDGTILTSASQSIPSAALPAGSVLQVIQTVKTDTFSTSSGTFTDITDLSATITPTSATSKILISVVSFTGANSVSALTVFNLVRNSTNISQPATTPTFNGTAGCFIAISDNVFPFSISFLDSPATTSATTYKVQIRTNAGTVFINRRNTLDCAFTSTITVMEIAA